MRKFIPYMLTSIKWVLFSDEDPIQARINACRSAVYDLVREARDVSLQPRRDVLRELARTELRRMESLELERVRMVASAVGGLFVGGFLAAWAVLALVF